MVGPIGDVSQCHGIPPGLWAPPFSSSQAHSNLGWAAPGPPGPSWPPYHQSWQGPEVVSTGPGWGSGLGLLIWGRMPLPQPRKSSSPAAGILPLGRRTGIPRGFWGASRLSCLWLSPGALVHIIHRPAAALPALEHLQRGDQAEHVPRHQLPQSGFHHPARQLQQLQAAHEQQGLDLRQVRAALRAGRWGTALWSPRGVPEGLQGQEDGVGTPSCPLVALPEGSLCPRLPSSLRHRCRQCASMCAVCHHVVKGLFVWCQGCSHGGHLQHIMKWLETSSHCPAGCGHLCEYT